MTNVSSHAPIAVDWRPVGWSLLWSWILIFIPTIVLAARVGSTSFTLRDDALTVRAGILTKKSQHIELYRVRDVATTENAMSGGKVLLTLQDGSVQTVQPVKDADMVGTHIRSLVNAAKSTRGVQHREDI